MLLEALILGIIVGKIMGGSIKGLWNLGLRMPIFLVLSFVLLLGTNIMIAINYDFVIQYRLIIYIISYALLFISLILNLKISTIWLIFLGGLMNAIAIIANNGSMPVDVALWEKLNLETMLTSFEIGALPNYIPIEEAYSFTAYLGKIFATPQIYPLKQVFSIGDVLVSLGMFFLVQRMMRAYNRHKGTNLLRFDNRLDIFKN